MGRHERREGKISWEHHGHDQTHLSRLLGSLPQQTPLSHLGREREKETKIIKVESEPTTHLSSHPSLLSPSLSPLFPILVPIFPTLIYPPTSILISPLSCPSPPSPRNKHLFIRIMFLWEGGRGEEKDEWKKMTWMLCWRAKRTRDSR